VAEYWGAAQIGKRLGVARSTVYEWVDRYSLIAYPRRRKSRIYLWTCDELIAGWHIAMARAYRDKRRQRKALRAGQAPP
jgi:transposase-like protein